MSSRISVENRDSFGGKDIRYRSVDVFHIMDSRLNPQGKVNTNDPVINDLSKNWQLSLDKTADRINELKIGTIILLES